MRKGYSGLASAIYPAKPNRTIRRRPRNGRFNTAVQTAAQAQRNAGLKVELPGVELARVRSQPGA